MNSRLVLENGEAAKSDYHPVQWDGSDKIVEAVKSCLQTSLVGESQNFRSSVAAAQRKFNQAQRMALATTALACLFSLAVMLAGLWESHRIARQTEGRLQSLENQAAASPDSFAGLRQGNWQPVGKLITQQGRTFVELKPAK
jgi:hypothetical protein